VNRAFNPHLAVALGLLLVAARPTWSQMTPGDPYGGMNGGMTAWNGYGGAPNGGYVEYGNSAMGHPAAGCPDQQCMGPGMGGCGMFGHGMFGHCLFGHGMGAAGCYPNGLWDRVHQPTRMWLALEYTGLRVEGAAIPALVTTSPAGTPQATAGVLPDAQVLFGDGDIADDWRHGGQVRLGWWLVDGQFVGIEGHYMALESESTNDVFTSNFSAGGSPMILARPFIDAGTGAPAAQLIAFPAFQNGPFNFPLDGSISVAFDSDFQSAGAVLRHVLWADFERSFRLDVLGGYRFINLDENLLIRGTRVTPPLAGDPAIVTESIDSFDTDNEFHGGEIGLLLEMYCGCWTFEMMGKCALGLNYQEVTINGTTTNSAAGVPPAVFTGGFLALPSNSGTFTQDEFMAVPEAHVRVKYDLTANLRLTFGYRFIYLSEVVRPGDQIDLNVTTTQLPAPLPPAGPGVPGGSPVQTFNSTSVWMHGLDAGVEFVY
jgi:hypothetical protein